jgi:hypothetical protein
MISFSQLFHGYLGINTKLVRRRLTRFHIQICQYTHTVDR